MNSLTLFTGSDGWTDNAIGCEPSPVTGAKSFRGSKGSFERSAELPSIVKPATSSVWPSAGARATCSVPMIEFAPARFSTTTL